MSSSMSNPSTSLPAFAATAPNTASNMALTSEYLSKHLHQAEADNRRLVNMVEDLIGINASLEEEVESLKAINAKLQDRIRVLTGQLP